MSYLEWQVLKNQKLDLDYKTLFGSSNSARNGFIPLLRELAEKVKKGTTQKYIGISQPYSNGITTRLEVIYDNGKIIDLRYDEIFADTQEEIKDENLKDFYRQSKYESPEYNKMTNRSFRQFIFTLKNNVLKAQSLTNFPTDNLKLNIPDIKEAYENYLFLAKKIQVIEKNNN